ncbi:TPA: hypothetical protein N0F65_001540 [Lagenidium giganteum]|uniref:Protein kinase domain-containing protein n=1 Tax=Lagenidium giganteum TaxID=4803 RepID=A0AAV2YMH9_9STRA|nr:TPA: hypothetical protein N0F65_001540 [Lagenidium giganteum]
MHGLTLALSHRDLKSRHILLNDQFTAKLSDLGHARNRPRTDLMAGPVFGSGRWMAPELLTSTARASVDGAAADVYSFGVLLVELDSHDLPYAHVLEDNPDMTETTLHRMIVDRQVKPEIDAATTSCPLRIQQLVMQCTTYEPEDRPSMADVVVQLREIARSQLLTRLDTIESAILQSQSQRSLQFFAYDSDTEEKQSEGRRSF